jgi:hypothetical protein
MAHNKVSCEDHHWQRVWRGTDTSGYWIQKCQRCGIERFVEPEDDYHTTIEYTIVNQTGREHFTELEAERDALRAELAELKARRCETCKKWYPFGCWVRNEILEDRGHPAGEHDDIYCSEWEPKEE